MKKPVACLVALAVVALSLAAQADPTAHVYTLKTVEIHGKARIPIASVDVDKAMPKVTLAELRQPLLQRVDQATHDAPF
jgi:hypothetical protein